MPASESDGTVTHVRAPGDPSAEGLGAFTPGTMLAGRYRIVAPLGSGGAGEVYRAEDTKLGQTVALKFVSRRITENSALLQRIVSEVRIGRQLSHPNLCRIYDMGEVGEQHFIAMEYVDGENLASLLRRVGRLPEDKAVEVAREICAALAAIHDRGVVHRDLKPANVMIDGRGHAHITDFGLAVIHGQPREEAFAGTPAYMAPEQLEGAEATEQSDIYALGLVLYEIFTGQRLFSGTLTEIAEAHRKPKRPPSTIARGISPAIERVILQCLEESPSDRPESVHEVLAALPQADPLRAAIAAGDTPSPRLVASAETVGELSLPAAWTVLVSIAALLVAIALLSRATMLYQRAPLTMSPDVLSERARDVIRSAGYVPRDRGARRWMGKDVTVMQEISAVVPAAQRSAAFHKLSPLRFGYRESPQPIVPHGRGGAVTESDPPLDVAGMTTVILDSRGQLIRFVRRPESARSGAGSADWSPLLAFAGLDAKALKETEPNWVAPVDHDRKQSWRSSVPGDARFTIDVHAASLDGRPVFFETVLVPHIAVHSRRPTQTATATEQFTGVTGFAVVFIIGLVLAGIVARRNLRLGRGDRPAARRIAWIVFVALFAAGLLSADHTTDPAGEWGLLVTIAGNALYNAGALWLFYIAAEPYVRRRQPELLISWNRTMRGYLRDPLVGRHILLGCLLGAILNIIYVHLLVLAPPWLGLAAPLPDHAFPEKLAGGVWPFVSLAALLGSVPLQSVGALFIFSAVRSVSRSDWLAALVLTVVATIPQLGRELGTDAEPFFAGCAVAVFVFALCRIGLLAGMVCLFVSSWLNTSLFLFEPRSWLFVPSLIYVIVLLALVLYGFRYSLGAKPPLGRLRVAD